MKKPKMNDESLLLQEIENGTYRNCYLIYNRKSTDEEQNQKNSIEYQRSENRRYAEAKNLNIADITIKGFCSSGVISEKHSGFKEDHEIYISEDGQAGFSILRPKFQRLLYFLSRGYFKGAISYCWDRVSRNAGDDALIGKLSKKGVDFLFVNATYDKSSSGELHKDIDSTFARHHSRVTSEKVSLAAKRAKEQGWCTYRAPIGYLNTGSMKEKPIDPVRGPIISNLFNMYATGKYSLSDLADYALSEGLTTLPMRRRRTKEELLDEELEIEDIPKKERPVSANHIQRILRNRFYLGEVRGIDGEYIQGTSHKPLTDYDTFEKVQELLSEKNVVVRYPKKLDLPLRGMIRCDDCKRVYTPYTKKGITYYRSRCKIECNNTDRNFSFGRFDKKAKKALLDMRLSDIQRNHVCDQLNDALASVSENKEEKRKKIDRKIERLNAKLNYLGENKLELLQTGLYTAQDLMNETKGIHDQIDDLRINDEISEEKIRYTRDEIVNLSELLSDVTVYYDMANAYDKALMFEILFTELLYGDNRLKTMPRSGFEVLNQGFVAVGCPTARVSELLQKLPAIRSMSQKLKAWISNLKNKDSGKEN